MLDTAHEFIPRKPSLRRRVTNRNANISIDKVALQESIAAKDKFGNGALHLAAMTSDLELAEILLKLPGLDMHDRNNSGLMPYQLAVIFNHMDIAPYLAPPEVHMEHSKAKITPMGGDSIMEEPFSECLANPLPEFKTKSVTKS